MNITDDRNEPRPAISTDPLPLPGESLRKEIDRLTDNQLGPWAAMAVVALTFCFAEWWRYIFHMPITRKSAVTMTLLCTIILALSFWRLFALRRQFRNLFQGLRGEHHAGRYLDDECSRLGYHVHHDVPGADFNVDHVLIGPGGIFVIETKNWSLPPKGTKASLHYDGSKLIKPDSTFDSAAINEARACADYIRKIVADYTDRKSQSLPVRPVLFFPGWWIDGKTFQHEVWVFGNDTLHKILPRERVRLSSEEIALFHQTLATYTRNFNTPNFEK